MAQSYLKLILSSLTILRAGELNPHSQIDDGKKEGVNLLVADLPLNGTTGGIRTRDL